MEDAKEGIVCPYLDTVNRHVLDFDFEKICSVTLSTNNVYACLVCGIYFQGRGRSSPAFMHSLNQEHHVFMHLETLKFYCLPDNYEIHENSLDDIKLALQPEYTDDDIRMLDLETKGVLDLSKKLYLPGYVGLNNIKANDYVNVVFQALAHVRPLRNHFLQSKKLSEFPPLVHCFGELVKKVWSNKAYKGHVSPHELLQAIHSSSLKKYFLGKLEDPQEFLTWFMNTFKGMMLPKVAQFGQGEKRRKQDVDLISSLFQGELEITSKPVSAASSHNMMTIDSAGKPNVKVVPFLHLPLDLPPIPLFQTTQLVPEVTIDYLLGKYNFGYPQDKGKLIVSYKILKCPKYLVLYVKRFITGKFKNEKNHTVVNFPLKDLEIREKAVVEQVFKYRLIANICHEGEGAVATEGSYKVQLLDCASQLWYEIQDLVVKDIVPQLLFMSESYIQIWEMQDNV